MGSRVHGHRPEPARGRCLGESDNTPDERRVELMVAELLLDPQPHEGRLRHAAQEVLTGLDFQESAVIDQQFEGELEAHMVGRRTAWGLWNTRPEVLWSFRRRLVVPAITKEVCPLQPKLVQNGAGIAPDIAVEQDAVEVIANRERGMAVVMGRAAHLPAPVEFPAAATALDHGLRTVTG